MKHFIKWLKSLFVKNKNIDFSMSSAPKGKSNKTDFQKDAEKQDAIRNSYYRKYSTVKVRR